MPQLLQYEECPLCKSVSTCHYHCYQFCLFSMLGSSALPIIIIDIVLFPIVTLMLMQ